VAFNVRPARPSDVASIISWTTDTFEWGDYVPDRLAGWIEDDDSEVIVCETESGEPAAVAHVLMLSGTEAWMEAARVHPDHKRSGMATAMNDRGVEWARGRGARVARLATEADNAAARGQVEALGYRAISQWVYASFDTSRPSAVEGPRLRPSHRSEVDPAWIFWSAGDLARRGRELLALGWRWRKATPADLEEAAAAARLFQSPSGWAIVEEDDEGCGCDWLAAATEEGPRLIESLLSLAASRGRAELSVKAPDVAWMTETLARAGGRPKEILIYAKPV